MISGLVDFGENYGRVSQDPRVFLGEDRPKPQFGKVMGTLGELLLGIRPWAASLVCIFSKSSQQLPPFIEKETEPLKRLLVQDFVACKL